MIVCIAEDRASFEVPLQLLILSLARHSPQLRVHLFYPVASAAFIRWSEGQPQVTLSTERLDGAYGWNVKPQAFLRLLELGHEDILWIDSDILVAGDVATSLSGMDRDTVGATEESLWGQIHDRKHAQWRRYGDSGTLRAALWGLKPGRPLPHVLNTAVLRVTAAHRPLLQRWLQMLGSEEYRRAQAMDFFSRPIHMAGDQDVLTALLASEEFSATPLRILGRGTEILQFMGLTGYTVWERFRSMLLGMPTFIHAQAYKPWVGFPSEPGLAAYLRAIYVDTAPYTLMAMKYRDRLDGDTRWMQPHFLLSRILRVAGLWYPPLVGLPIACAKGTAQVGRELARRIGLVSNERAST